MKKSDENAILAFGIGVFVGSLGMAIYATRGFNKGLQEYSEEMGPMYIATGKIIERVMQGKYRDPNTGLTDQDQARQDVEFETMVLRDKTLDDLRHLPFME